MMETSSDQGQGHQILLNNECLMPWFRKTTYFDVIRTLLNTPCYLTCAVILI